MSYLIDTNIIIYSIKGDSVVHDHLLKNENIPKSISVITYGELLFGAKKIPELMKGLGSGIKEFKKAANVEDGDSTKEIADKSKDSEK